MGVRQEQRPEVDLRQAARLGGLANYDHYHCYYCLILVIGGLARYHADLSQFATLWVSDDAQRKASILRTPYGQFS